MTLGTGLLCPLLACPGKLTPPPSVGGGAQAGVCGGICGHSSGCRAWPWRGGEGLRGAHFWKGRNKPAVFPDNTFLIIHNPKGATDKPLELVSKFTMVVRAIDKISDQS